MLQINTFIENIKIENISPHVTSFSKDIKQNFLCKDLKIEIIKGRNKGSYIESKDNNIINQDKNISKYQE